MWDKSGQVTAKATVLFATTASFGMLVMSMQNLGLIGMKESRLLHRGSCGEHRVC